MRALRDAPGYPALRERLARLAQAAAGPGAVVSEHPDGGVVAEAPAGGSTAPWTGWPRGRWTRSVRR